jgi:hypothetical protein
MFDIDKHQFGNGKKIFIMLKKTPGCNTNKMIPATWVNIARAGDSAQKQLMANVRKIYVGSLKKAMAGCTSRHFCTLDEVGSSGEDCTVSDVDLNLKFNVKQYDVGTGPRTPVNEIIQDVLGMIEKVYQDIDTFHTRFFSTSLSETFDINVYASDFLLHDTNKLECGSGNNIGKMVGSWCVMGTCRQRHWAFLRAYEVISKNDYLLSYFQQRISFYNSIYVPTATLFQQLEAKHTGIIDNVKHAYRIALDPKSSNNDVAEAFSASKYLETDTYRSVGAYLHILKQTNNANNRLELHYSLYLDSVLDNYGFLLENLFRKYEGCSDSVIPQYNLLRVAKYLCRMCDAILLYNGVLDIRVDTSHAIYRIKELSVVANNARKCDTSNPNDNNKLLIELQVALEQWHPPIISGDPLKDPEWWFRAITHLCIFSYPFERVCAQLGGRAIQGKTVIELRAMARARGDVHGFSRMRKHELLHALRMLRM